MVSNMKKIDIKNTDKAMYYEKLDNGLEVYMYPISCIKQYKASFFTKFGSIYTSFKLNNKTINVPNGIAHFLEHKMFEQEQGISVFDFYSKSGTHCNAYTSNNITNYYIMGENNINKNINFLLDYVQSPCFTDENVNKEIGIIEQELLMYKDAYGLVSYENLMSNMFFNSNYKYKIGGTVEDIKKINKTMLYECYNAFYNPSNMVLVITGNFNKEKMIELIKKNQSSKVFGTYKHELSKVNEPDKVVKEYEKMTVGISTPIVKMAIKIKKHDTNIKYRMYLSLILEYLFDKTSTFIDELKKENILESDIEYELMFADTHDVWIINTTCKKYNILIDKIKEKLKNFEIDREYFERMKKVLIVDFVVPLQSFKRINSGMIYHIIEYEKIQDNLYEIIKSLDYDEMNNIKSKLVLDNISTYIID